MTNKKIQKILIIVIHHKSYLFIYLFIYVCQLILTLLSNKTTFTL